MKDHFPPTPIAIIGISCWYPDARNPRQLWENILSRRRQFRRLPEQRLPLADYYNPDSNEPDMTYGQRAAVIDGFNFDWASRRIPFSTFNATDIAHWLALEMAIEAVEDAGYSKENISGKHTGVIVGNSLTGEQSRANAIRLRWPFVRRAYRAAAQSKGLPHNQMMEVEGLFENYYKSVFPPIDEDTLAGGLSNTIAGRICNFLDLHGGGYTVDGACSSSLLAVATAVRGLNCGDLNLALAGGVDISLDTFELIGFAKTGALTVKDMMVYDRRGNGFIPGEGCGFVMLKRLADAKKDNDYIYAVLHGWGISSDGGGTGITAPNAEGQSMAIRSAYSKAPYNIHDLSFIEGHGTGTTVGDRVELEAISIARADEHEESKRSCGITSLKSIIGHTKAATGVGGLIKAIISVNRRMLPPTAGCREPHPTFDSKAKSLFPILRGEMHDPGKIMRAGVSAMGFGGINCHVTLESPDSPPSPRLEPSVREKSLLVSNQDTEVFVLTADTYPELEEKIGNLLEMINDISMAELMDLAAKLGQETDRKAKIRLGIVSGEIDNLFEQLNEAGAIIRNSPPQKGEMHQDSNRLIWIGNQVERTRIGMLFPGQGSQMINMARLLTDRFPRFEDMVKSADQLLEAAGSAPVGGLMYLPLDRAKNPEQIKEWSDTLASTENAQPAICLASTLWLRFLEDLGIKPAVVGGHSLGELTAFHAAGAFDIDTLIRFATVRGKAMVASGDQAAGAMISLRCSDKDAAEVLEQVEGYLITANINGPRQTVLSGEKAAVEEAIRIANKQGIQTYRLNVSNAFHSKMASKAAEILEKADFLPNTLTDAGIRLFTSINGQELEAGLDLRKHFANQVVSQVDFISLANSMAETCDVLLEVGPGRVLSGLTNSIVDSDDPACLPVESSPFKDQDMNTALATLFVNGVDVLWEKLYENRMVRPFISPSKRLFIENPCERPFDIADPGFASLPSMGIFDTLITDLISVPPEDVSLYLKNRAPFLAEVIQADMKYSGKGFPAGTKALPADMKEVRSTSVPKKPEPTKAKSEDKDLESVLFSLVEKITGFPGTSLDLSMRLLDDLNLDSIKAGDLLVKIIKKVGLTGHIEPRSLANASLSEILSVLDEAHAKPGEEDLESVLLSLVEKITGFPGTSLDLSMRLLDDLNLDSIKAGDLLVKVIKKAELTGRIEPRALANASLSEVLSTLEEARAESGGALKPVSGRIDAGIEFQTWVREFKVGMIKESFPEQLQEKDWQTCKVLILTTPDTEPLSKCLHDDFFQLGAVVQVADFQKENEKKQVGDPSFTHLIAILPRTSDESDPDRASLTAMIERLTSIVSPPLSAHESDDNTMIAFVQFGRGHFGAAPRFSKIDQCCSSALAKSLHLERTDLSVRALDFSTALDPEIISGKIIGEISTPGIFEAVGYDYELTRRVPKQQLLQPVAYKKRETEWSSKDVILVTGGAKGITASCALKLAKTTGSSMALVGSSPHPDTLPDRTGSEIVETLKKYEERGLIAEYFSCDVTDPESVNDMIKDVQNKMGAVTGVVHGAGMNVPRVVNQVSVDQALKEVGPKVMGALNLVKALKDASLKMFAGLSSIIGITGMPGNAWYGFSNETLDVILHRYEAEHPDTCTLSVAYSIWKDEGMGARLGSVNQLKQMGIDAIPTDEGVDRFVHLFMSDPGTNRVIIAARLDGLDTWRMEALPEPEKARYLEKPLYSMPGVESVFQAHLSLDHDPYLVDHLFNGSYLFPTVFGLEAMTQAVCHVTGRNDSAKGYFNRIEDIKLERPITVDSESGTDIVIRAMALEQEESGVLKINAGVSKHGAGGDFFSATFVSGLEYKQLKDETDLPDKPLDIVPKLDLYRENLLFQGPLFHRISKIHSLTHKKEKGVNCIFDTEIYSDDRVAKGAFPKHEEQNMFLGDAFFRDTMLQSAQLLVPQASWLPINIRSMDIRHDENTADTLTAKIQLDKLTDHGNEIECSVIATDSDGNIREKIEGYRLRLMMQRKDNPSVADLIRPDERDCLIVQKFLHNTCLSLGFDMPNIGLKYIAGIHDLKKDQRHELTLPLLKETALKAMDRLSDADCSIRWLDSGRPVVNGHEDKIGISLSHDERLCFCVSFTDPCQGCDIAPVTHRSRQDWTGLVGQSEDKLLDEMLNASEPLDRAGTRIWSAMEALLKASGEKGTLKMDRKEGDVVLFQSPDLDDAFIILTIPIYLTWGPERIFSLVVRKERKKHLEPSLKTVERYPGYEDLLDKRHSEIFQGPQGQMGFIQRIPVGFRPNAQLSRKVYFSNFFFWVGEIREVAMWPVLGKVAEQFSGGEWGLVTNKSFIRILGETTAQSIIEVRLWSSENGGSANSTMDLVFDFRKMMPDGSYERVAWSEQQVTWVRILDHGIVQPEPYPDYYWDLIKEMIPRYDAPNDPEPLPESLVGLKDFEGDEEVYMAPKGPVVRPILCEQNIETSLENSNLVGNIYFANYYAWQGITRDKFFFKLIPEYYRGAGEKGELLCIECRVDHLREAMPFDNIVVTMSLKSLKTCSALFYFEYFRQDADGTRIKLAFGEHLAVWVTRDSDENALPTPFPEPVREAFRLAIAGENDSGS